MKRSTSKLYVVYVVLGLASFTLVAILFLLRTARPLEASTTQGEPNAPGRISGFVTDSHGKPIGGIAVDLYPPSYDYSLRSVSTDSAGWYKFMILGPGEYRIGFRDGPNARYLPEFYNDTQALESATTVLVIGNSVENINSVLTKASLITGRITISGAILSPDRTVSVIAYKFINDAMPHWEHSRETQPLSDTGIYTITGLSSGTYRVCASTSSVYGSSPYLVDCYGNVSHLEGAKDVILDVEATVGSVDILLGDGSDYATISGRVTKQAGMPISGTQVSVYQTGLPGGVIGYSNSTLTDSNGDYKIENLISEVISYVVYFYPDSTDYVGQYYEDSFDVANAHVLTPKSREVISNVNASLKPAAQISGIVTLQGEVPSQEGYLYTVRKVGDEWQTTGTAAIVSGSGQYTASALPAGHYRVCAAFWLGDESLGNCFGGSVPISATDVIVQSGETRTNVNFDVSTNIYEGGISGKVTYNNGPIAGIRIDLEIGNYTGSTQCEQSEQKFSPLRTVQTLEQIESIYTFTDNQGNYRFQGLHAGYYRVIFTDPSGYFATEYYQESSLPYESTGLNLQCGAQLQHIDRILSVAGAITGTVRLALGRPITHATVTLYRKDTDFWQPIPLTFYTGEDGSYEAKGLLPGTYHLAFYANEILYPFDYTLCEYYSVSDECRVESATDVIVVAGQTTSKINMILGPKGIIFLPLVLRK